MLAPRPSLKGRSPSSEGRGWGRGRGWKVGAVFKHRDALPASWKLESGRC